MKKAKKFGLFFVVSCLSLSLCGCSDDPIKSLKKSTISSLGSNVTVGTALSTYSSCIPTTQKWETFESEQKERVVEFSCQDKDMPMYLTGAYKNAIFKDRVKDKIREMLNSYQMAAPWQDEEYMTKLSELHNKSLEAQFLFNPLAAIGGAMQWGLAVGILKDTYEKLPSLDAKIDFIFEDSFAKGDRSALIKKWNDKPNHEKQWWSDHGFDALAFVRQFDNETQNIASEIKAQLTIQFIANDTNKKDFRVVYYGYKSNWNNEFESKRSYKTHLLKESVWQNVPLGDVLNMLNGRL